MTIHLRSLVGEPYVWSAVPDQRRFGRGLINNLRISMKKRKLESDHIERMQNGRKSHKEKTCGLVCRIDERFEIYVDEFNYALHDNGKPKYWYPELSLVISDLMNMKIKELALSKSEKSFHSLGEALIEARNWVEQVVEPALDSSGESTISERRKRLEKSQ